MARNWFRPKTAHVAESVAILTLAEYEAREIAMEQLIAENDRLRHDRDTWADLRDHAYQCRDKAVAERDRAELETVNARLRGRIDDLEHALSKHGLPIPYPPLGDLPGQTAITDDGQDAA